MSIHRLPSEEKNVPRNDLSIFVDYTVHQFIHTSWSVHYYRPTPQWQEKVKPGQTPKIAGNWGSQIPWQSAH